MNVSETCLGCGSKDDLYFETVKIVHRPPDTYIALLVGAFINTAVSSVLYATGTSGIFHLFGFAGMGVAIGYYHSRSTWASCLFTFCKSCRNRYAGKAFNRIAIMIIIVLTVFGGMIITSAVAGDDYFHVPLIIAGVIFAASLYYKLLAKPKFVTIGEKNSVVSIPGIGLIQIKNPWD